MRTITALYIGISCRHRTYGPTLGELSETSFPDGQVQGPGTCMWLLCPIGCQDTDPSDRHGWWKTVCGVSSLDEEVDEHALLSDLLEMAVLYDQFNPSESCRMEMVARRYQMWEDF